MNNFIFKEHTSICLGGPAQKYIKCTSVDRALEISALLEESNEKYMVIGGGCNILVGDEGFVGSVIQLDIKKREMSSEGDHCRFLVGAGEDFDSIVEEAVNEDWAGLELLSGIPGSVGACPIQNIGAFGAEVSDIIDVVHCLDTKTGELVKLTNEQCRFGYRTSIFNSSEKGRYWILFVEFLLNKPSEIEIAYPDLAEYLDTKKVKEVLPVRNAVLELRKARGMVVGEGMPKSVGSFFKNPIITAKAMKELQADFPGGVPCYPMGDDYKVPAAWLIGQTQYKKGFTHKGVGISKFHNLCLVNHGEGTFKELMELASMIRDEVSSRFSIGLEIEPEIFS